MNGHRASLRNPWVSVSAAIALLLIVISGGIGFVWLPGFEPDQATKGLWYRICSAAGVLRPTPPAGAVVQAAIPATNVAMTPGALGAADPDSAGRGATLALRCAMCHGTQGISLATAPNLAGQYAIGTFKQLRDFSSGARPSGVMAPLVTGLSNQDMRDLAVFYASLPRAGSAASDIPRIVASGAPMRNIAPCAACHGNQSHKEGSPMLEGQPAAYLLAQLQAFATGKRHNDIDALMRNMAHGMTEAEMNDAAAFYAAQR